MKKNLLPLLLGMCMIGNANALPAIVFKDVKNNLIPAKEIPEGLREAISQIEKKNADIDKVIIYPTQDAFTLHILSARNWEAVKAKVKLNKENQVQDLIYPYEGIESELLTGPDEPPVCPDPSVELLAISAYPGKGDVDNAIKTVVATAQKKYKTKSIVSADADGKTYKNWLSCPNLKGVFSIGHGNALSMVVGKGDVINFRYFSQPHTINKFKSTTVLINSCKVYNEPFGTQIMFGNVHSNSAYVKNPGPNAYEYIGGHTILSMVQSEQTSACFMSKAIEGAPMDYQTLKSCIKEDGVYYQNFGISHPGLYFDKVKNNNQHA